MSRYTTNIVFLTMLIVCLSSLSCSSKNNLKQYENETLRQAWFPWSGYAGELEASNNIDSTYGINLIVEKGADDVDPIKLVIAGHNDFGVGAAEYVIDANMKGSDLVIIGVINYKSPTCFIALVEKGVRSFADFKGKRIGILTGTETETVYRLLKLKGLIPSSQIIEIEVPFDITSFITTNSYDIRPAYIYDEPISLEAKGIKYSVIKPDEYVSMISGVYFTTAKKMRESPEKVKAVVFALADGWKKALSNPDHAINLLKSYDKSIDSLKELKSLKAGAEYFSGENGKVLWASQDRWKAFASALVSLNKFTNIESVLKSVDQRYIEEYHKIK